MMMWHEMPGTGDGTVLVVDDDPQVLNLFEDILERDYAVEAVDSGETALEVMGEHIDVCLVDRRMPGLAGSQVVQRLRQQGFDQPVAMVTAIEPDFDVIDLGFDDYLMKPVDPGELQDLVKSLMLRVQYDDHLREYFSLAAKVSALRNAKTSDALAANEEYRQAIDDLNAIRREAKDSLEAADDAGLLEELLWDSFLDGSEAGRAEIEIREKRSNPE